MLYFTGTAQGTIERGMRYKASNVIICTVHEMRIQYMYVLFLVCTINKYLHVDNHDEILHENCVHNAVHVHCGYA